MPLERLKYQAAMIIAENLEVGMTIAMLGGVVEVALVSFPDTENVVVGVNIGKLRNHTITFKRTSRMEVVNMPDNLRGWYGV